MKIRGAVGLEPRWVEAFERLRVPGLVSVRCKERRDRIRFSIRVPVRNPEFAATFLFLLSPRVSAPQAGKDLTEMTPPQVESFVAWVQVLDALLTRFKRHVRLLRYPPHIVAVNVAHGVRTHYPGGAVPPITQFYYGEFLRDAPAPDDPFVEAMRIFGVEWGVGCIKVYTGRDARVHLVHELLHAIEWALGITPTYLEDGPHERELLSMAERALGGNNPFVAEAHALLADPSTALSDSRAEMA